MIINKKNIILILILSILMIIACSYIPVNAILTADKLSGTSNNTGEIEPVLASVLKIAGIIGSAMSIITMILLGVKYMLGSVEEKAEYKKSLFPYMIGAVFVFGASTIAGIVYSFLEREINIKNNKRRNKYYEKSIKNFCNNIISCYVNVICKCSICCYIS